MARINKKVTIETEQYFKIEIVSLTLGLWFTTCVQQFTQFEPAQHFRYRNANVSAANYADYGIR